MDIKQIDLPDLDKIITDYGTFLLRMSFLYLKDYHLAEDAVQDTLIKVYEGYSGFHGKSSEKTWVTRIAVNVCKNYLRANWWKRIDTTTALETIPVDEIEMQDDALLKTIMSLPGKYKEVVLLYYYQELKIHEIAEVLHIPESTVSVRLKRAKEKLRSQIKGDYCYE